MADGEDAGRSKITYTHRLLQEHVPSASSVHDAVHLADGTDIHVRAGSSGVC